MNTIFSEWEEILEGLEQPEGALTLEDVMKRALAIRAIRQEVEQIKEEMRVAMELYRQQIARREDSIEFLQRQVIAYLANTGRRRMVLPTGETVFIQTRKEVVYDVDPEELARCYGFIRIKEEPDLSALRKAALSGELQDGVHVEERIGLSFRKSSESNDAT